MRKLEKLEYIPYSCLGEFMTQLKLVIISFCPVLLNWVLGMWLLTGIVIDYLLSGIPKQESHGLLGDGGFHLQRHTLYSRQKVTMNDQISVGFFIFKWEEVIHHKVPYHL